MHDALRNGPNALLCVTNPTATPIIWPGLANSYGPVTPNILNQTDSISFNGNGWVTGSLIVDPSAVPGLTLANTVTVYDYQNAVIFKHTFAQAFTLNFENLRLTKITLSEPSSLKYTADLIYQLYSGVDQDQPPGFGRINYSAVAPFVATATTSAQIGAVPTFGSANSNTPTSGSAFTISTLTTLTAISNIIVLIYVNSAITCTTALAGTMTVQIDATTVFNPAVTNTNTTLAAAGVFAVAVANNLAVGTHSLTLSFSTGAISGTNTGNITAAFMAAPPGTYMFAQCSGSALSGGQTNNTDVGEQTISEPYPFFVQITSNYRQNPSSLPGGIANLTTPNFTQVINDGTPTTLQNNTVTALPTTVNSNVVNAITPIDIKAAVFTSLSAGNKVAWGYLIMSVQP